MTGHGRDRLWTRGGPPTTPATMAVIEHRDGSELLLQIDSNRAAAAPLIRHTSAMSVRDRIARRAAWAVVRSGAGRLLLRNRLLVETLDSNDPPLHQYLAEAVGRPEVHISVAFGPPRPNQKPVIRIMEPDGTTIAYAKLGWNELTRGLVETEADFLGAMTPDTIPGVSTPSVISRGTWREMEVAVFEALLGRPGRPRLSAETFRAVSMAAVIGEPDEPLLPHLRAQAATIAGTVGELVMEKLDAWTKQWAGLPLETGRWHGDWTPWNTASGADGDVILWDWERTRTGVPVGFDPIHYRLQPPLAGHASPEAVMAETKTTTGPILVAMGIPSEQHPALLHLYLIDNLIRHAGAVGGEDASRLVRRLAALLDTGGIESPES